MKNEIRINADADNVHDCLGVTEEDSKRIYKVVKLAHRRGHDSVSMIVFMCEHLGERGANEVLLAFFYLARLEARFQARIDSLLSQQANEN